MAKKKAKAATVEEQNKEFLMESTKALTNIRLEPFTDGREFNRAVNLQEMKVLTSLDMFTRLEFGKRLLDHRANLPNGDFLKDVAEIGIEQRTAYRYMAAAKVVAGMPSLDATKLTMRKLYEIGEELDEEEIKQLEAGEVVRDIQKDDIERMGPTELRKALRKERQKRTKARDKIEELEDQIAEIRGARRGGDERVNTPLVRAILAALQALAKVRLLCETEECIDELREISNPDDGTTVADNLYRVIHAQIEETKCAIKPPLYVRQPQEVEPGPMAGSSRAS